MARRLFFRTAYWFGYTPWNTGITPPEVYDYLKDHSPGRALDLGCGTGTNVITLAEHGWQVEGVDFIPRAIRIARRKAKRKGVENRTEFRVGSVLDSEMYRGNYDLILDIGCFHGLPDADINVYIELVKTHLSPGGCLLIYVHLEEAPDPGHGASETILLRLSEVLKMVRRVDGEESSRPSAWLEFVKD